MSDRIQATPSQQIPGPADETGIGSADAGPVKANTWRTVGLVILGLFAVALALVIAYGLATHPIFTARIRDISIIVLAIATMVTTVLLAILLIELQNLTVLLRDQVIPILESLNRTAGTVRGTTTFVSDTVVRPMIAISSYASGVRATVHTLFGSPGGSKSRSRQAVPGTAGDHVTTGEGEQS